MVNKCMRYTEKTYIFVIFPKSKTHFLLFLFIENLLTKLFLIIRACMEKTHQ